MGVFMFTNENTVLYVRNCNKFISKKIVVLGKPLSINNLITG